MKALVVYFGIISGILFGASVKANNVMIAHQQKMERDIIVTATNPNSNCTNLVFLSNGEAMSVCPDGK